MNFKAVRKLELLLLSFPFISLFGCSSLYTRTMQVPFAKPGDVQLTLDIYKPHGNVRTPAVLVVHGGGWASRSGDMSNICERLAVHGFSAINMTYRLAPNHHFPAASDDVRSALAWIRAHSDELNIDRSRIYLWGYSAGGHLALLVGLDPAAQVRAIVAGGAPSDLTHYPNSPLVNTFMGVPFAGHEDLWRKASPVFIANKNSPPVFLYHGQWDSLVEPKDMERMAARLRERNVQVKSHLASGLGHIATYLLSGTSIRMGIEFLERH